MIKTMLVAKRRSTRHLLTLLAIPLLLIAGCGDSPVGVWKLDRDAIVPDTTSIESEVAADLFRQNVLRSIPEMTLTIDEDGTFTETPYAPDSDQQIGPARVGTWSLADDGTITLNPEAAGASLGEFRLEGGSLVLVNPDRPGRPASTARIVYRRSR